MSDQDFDPNPSEEAQENNYVPGDTQEDHFVPDLQDLHATQYSSWAHYNPVAYDGLAMRGRQYQPFTDIQSGCLPYLADNAAFIGSSTVLPHGEWVQLPPSESLESSFELPGQHGSAAYSQPLLDGTIPEMSVPHVQSSGLNLDNGHCHHDPNTWTQTESVRQEMIRSTNWIASIRSEMLRVQQAVDKQEVMLAELEAHIRPQQPQQPQQGQDQT